MVRSISAIFENGVFRPTEPVNGLEERAAVRLTIEPTANPSSEKRILGLQRDKVIEISPDFDEELGDDFWLGEKR
jgi:predicted DNA-binding antitoxin AbrB/MazE fold protein